MPVSGLQLNMVESQRRIERLTNLSALLPFLRCGWNLKGELKVYNAEKADAEAKIGGISKEN